MGFPTGSKRDHSPVTPMIVQKKPPEIKMTIFYSEFGFKVTYYNTRRISSIFFKYVETRMTSRISTLYLQQHSQFSISTRLSSDEFGLLLLVSSRLLTSTNANL